MFQKSIWPCLALLLDCCFSVVDLFDLREMELETVLICVDDVSPFVFFLVNFLVCIHPHCCRQVKEDEVVAVRLEVDRMRALCRLERHESHEVSACN